jgi:hypothetical protein
MPEPYPYNPDIQFVIDDEDDDDEDAPLTGKATEAQNQNKSVPAETV